jgi:hypothetical protein
MLNSSALRLRTSAMASNADTPFLSRRRGRSRPHRLGFPAQRSRREASLGIRAHDLCRKSNRFHLHGSTTMSRAIVPLGLLAVVLAASLQRNLVVDLDDSRNTASGTLMPSCDPCRRKPFDENRPARPRIAANSVSPPLEKATTIRQNSGCMRPWPSAPSFLLSLKGAIRLFALQARSSTHLQTIAS